MCSDMHLPTQIHMLTNKQKFKSNLVAENNIYMLDMNINPNKIFFIEENVHLGGVICMVIKKIAIFNRLGNVVQGFASW